MLGVGYVPLGETGILGSLKAGDNLKQDHVSEKVSYSRMFCRGGEEGKDN